MLCPGCGEVGPPSVPQNQVPHGVHTGLVTHLGAEGRLVASHLFNDRTGVRPGEEIKRKDQDQARKPGPGKELKTRREEQDQARKPGPGDKIRTRKGEEQDQERRSAQ